MNASFPRILTLLRKELGFSQRRVAGELGVSSALLSHYEKGIRECGLDFLVRAADYYHVSCDYLLGRTADRNGATIAVDEIPEEDPHVKDNLLKGSVLPVLNKKLIVNSLNIVFDLLQKCGNKSITMEVSGYLSVAVYTVFRLMYSGNPQNTEAMFSIPAYRFAAKVSGEMGETAAVLGHLAGGHKVGEYIPLAADAMPSLATESLAEEYPLFATSLFNLLKNAETRMKDEK